MSKIIYYVATSLDGYISGKDGDISQFAFEGKAVEQYQADLVDFKTVIMGRNTYEFGYQYGLKPGQAAYPHMNHHIFSKTLQFDEPASNVFVESLSLENVDRIRDESPTDVYLCGGGEFAGWLLQNGRIDLLKIKLNPIILGTGVRLFGNSTFKANFKLVEKESFPDGLQFLTYQIK